MIKAIRMLVEAMLIGVGIYLLMSVFKGEAGSNSETLLTIGTTIIIVFLIIFIIEMIGKCRICRKTVILRRKYKGYSYCSDDCKSIGLCMDKVPKEIIQEEINDVHNMECPKCGGPGPVDIQRHYKVHSLLIMSWFKEESELCCKACGTKNKLGALAYSTCLGWWSVPGLFITPAFIVMNIAGLCSLPRQGKPSKALKNRVMKELSRNIDIDDE